MIPHSQPYINHAAINAVQQLLKEKSLQTPGALDSVLAVFKSKFHQNNFYFTQSGTHALYWILKGLNLSKEDEIIIPTYVCSSVYDAVMAVGAKPILCDIEFYWHMSPKNIERTITKNTKAIVIVNLFGMHLDCAQFRYPGITLINDLCQSFDNLRNKNQDNGDFVLYSFHPTKFVTAGCGGGFSVLNNKIKFKNYLSKGNLGFSISNLNLQILKTQLDLYDLFVSKRKEIAQIYFSSIEEKYTQYINQDENVFYRFPLIQADYEFNYIQNIFQERGVAIRRGVDELIHRKIGLPDDGFPNAILSYDKTVSLPIYPSLDLENAKFIASILSEV